MVKRGQTVLIAVSGGVDSMVLLHLFHAVASRHAVRLAVVHANHQLRGDESDADEKFVQSASAALGVPFFSRRLPTLETVRARRISRQVAARRLRYAWFDEARHSVGADAVAVAHNADDNAETVLLNILRGTGLRGLAGIPPVRLTGHIIRPLLFASRAQIAAFARNRRILFREDSSNRSLKYARNLLRLRVLPALQSSRRSSIIRDLTTVAETMTRVVARLEKRVDRAWRARVRRSVGHDLSLSLVRWDRLDWLVREHLLLRLLDTVGVDPTEQKVRALERVIGGQAGRRVMLSGSRVVEREHDSLSIRSTTPAADFSYPVIAGRTNRFPGFSIAVSDPGPRPAALVARPGTEYVDADRLRGPLRVRTWKAGDWFVPLGMRGRKKLSDFFVDRKLPRREKQHIPLLEAGGSILWVCGQRLDDRFKLTDHTTRVVRLTYYPEGTEQNP